MRLWRIAVGVSCLFLWGCQVSEPVVAAAPERVHTTIRTVTPVPQNSRSTSPSAGAVIPSAPSVESAESALPQDINVERPQPLDVSRPFIFPAQNPIPAATTEASSASLLPVSPAVSAMESELEVPETLRPATNSVNTNGELPAATVPTAMPEAENTQVSEASEDLDPNIPEQFADNLNEPQRNTGGDTPVLPHSPRFLSDSEALALEREYFQE